MRRLIIIMLFFLLVLSCKFDAPTTTQYYPQKTNSLIDNIVKVSDKNFNTKAEPNIVTFEDKVIYTPIKTTQNLPSSPYFEFNFKVHGNMKNSIKINDNSNFQIVFQQGSDFKIIDSDIYNDNIAVIQIPQGVFDGYATVLRESSGKTSNANILLEDSLYYAKQELKELETSNTGLFNFQS